jgi:hypothetical protein
MSPIARGETYLAQALVEAGHVVESLRPTSVRPCWPLRPAPMTAVLVEVADLAEAPIARLVSAAEGAIAGSDRRPGRPAARAPPCGPAPTPV